MNRRWWLVVLLLCSSALQAQTPAPTAWDPGWAMLNQGKFSDAHDFFVGLLAKTHNDAMSMWGAAFADYDLKNYDEAVRYLHQAIAQIPNMQGAHHLLIRVYAAQGDWKSFDAERAVVQDAQRKGLDTETDLIIDDFQVNGEEYRVHAYEPLTGKVHTRYRFLHFGPDGKVDRWIACESDDVDQMSFRKMHPDKAAVGERSFSLDSYSPPSEGLMKFYWDGEPTYEQVRADVMGKASPVSSTTGTLAPATK